MWGLERLAVCLGDWHWKGRVLWVIAKRRKEESGAKLKHQMWVSVAHNARGEPRQPVDV